MMTDCQNQLTGRSDDNENAQRTSNLSWPGTHHRHQTKRSINVSW